MTPRDMDELSALFMAANATPVERRRLVSAVQEVAGLAALTGPAAATLASLRRRAISR